MVRIDSPEVQDFEKEHLSTLRSLAPECMVLLKKNGDFPLSEHVLNGNRRKSERFPVFHHIGVIADPVGPAEGTVMNRLEQVCLSGSVPSEEQIDAGVRAERQLFIVSEILQFQCFDLHFASEQENGCIRRPDGRFLLFSLLGYWKTRTGRIR